MLNEDELALTERVGRALAQLGLTTHVARVRTYYRAIRTGRPYDGWSHEMNIEWLRLPAAATRKRLPGAPAQVGLQCMRHVAEVHPRGVPWRVALRVCARRGGWSLLGRDEVAREQRCSADEIGTGSASSRSDDIEGDFIELDFEDEDEDDDAPGTLWCITFGPL